MSLRLLYLIFVRLCSCGRGMPGQPAAGARMVRSGLAALGWREDYQGLPEHYRALAARLVITLAWRTWNLRWGGLTIA